MRGLPMLQERQELVTTSRKEADRLDRAKRVGTRRGPRGRCRAKFGYDAIRLGTAGGSTRWLA